MRITRSAMAVATAAAAALMLAACSSSSTSAETDREAGALPDTSQSSQAASAVASEVATEVAAEASTAAAAEAVAGSAGCTPRALRAGTGLWPYPDAGELRLVPYSSLPELGVQPKGQVLKIRGNELLFEEIGTTYGGDMAAGTFALPTFTGAWTTVPAGQSGLASQHCLTWIMAVDGGLGTIPDGFPGEVAFLASGSGYSTRESKDAGAVAVDLGTNIDPHVAALKLPANWKNAATIDEVMVGELRLFSSDAKIPSYFIPADGREVPAGSRLAESLTYAGLSEKGKPARVPVVQAPAGYTWVIAKEGVWGQ